MNVLIDVTEQVSNSLQSNGNKKMEVLKLLKDKIEDAVINDKSITTIITNSFAECRNNICIEGYELDEEYLYISNENFEIHIKSNDVTDLTYDSDEESFYITCKDNIIILIFDYGSSF